MDTRPEPIEQVQANAMRAVAPVRQPRAASLRSPDRTKETDRFEKDSPVKAEFLALLAAAKAGLVGYLTRRQAQALVRSRCYAKRQKPQPAGAYVVCPGGRHAWMMIEGRWCRKPISPIPSS
jgi:hypothetical protein